MRILLAILASIPVVLAGVVPIASLDATDFRDLQFLKPLLAEARVVQLGENSHGTAEPQVLRGRLARFLHEELGFNVLAFESALYLCHRADSRASDVEPQRTITSSLVGVWHTREMLPLFSYLRQTRLGPRPLRLAGFDVQPIGSAKRERPQFFADLVARVDERYAAEVKTFDTSFIAELDKGSASRREYLRTHAAASIAGYQRLAAFLDANRAAIEKAAGREAPLVAAQEARSMVAYLRYQTSAEMKDYAEIRDRGMADNVAFLAEQLFPGEKIIVWAHNYHVRYGNAEIAATKDVFPGVAARSMGSWVRERFGSRVYTIGQYEYEGRALDNARQPYAIAPAADGSLEQRLSAAGLPLAFVHLRGPAAEGFEWLFRPVSARYNGQHVQILIPSAHYDAILFTSKVSPPTFLY
jgi:erythromycin esterase